MATGDQKLSLGIDADASGLLKATDQASKALEELQGDVRDLGRTDAEINVEADTRTAQQELDNLQSSVEEVDVLDPEVTVSADASAAQQELDRVGIAVDELDDGVQIPVSADTTAAQQQLDNVGTSVEALDDGVEISVGLETQRINRDLANLNRVLEGIERQKASPDVGLDLTQLLKDETRVEKAIDELEKRSAAIAVEVDVQDADVGSLTAVGSSMGATLGDKAGSQFGEVFAGTIAGQLSGRLPSIVSTVFPGVAASVEREMVTVGELMAAGFSQGAKRVGSVAESVAAGFTKSVRSFVTAGADVLKSFKRDVAGDTNLDEIFGKGKAPKLAAFLPTDAELGHAQKKLADVTAEARNTQNAIASIGSGGGGSGGGGGSAVGGAADDFDHLGGSTLGAAGGVRAVGIAGAGAATGIGALVVGLAAGAKVALDFGEAAADVETSVSQLDALVSGQGLSGEAVFADLQAWAAETPFAIDDATEAIKKLVAAGVGVDEITRKGGYLDQLGNVASATGVPLESLAVTFAQMESSGKASYENLQQLAEAGIPVWGTLSDKIGISVGELQDLAIKGKLPVDTIKLLRGELNNLYPTAMQDQADTFNGQMSTLKDNLDQAGQTLGTLFLPFMSEVVDLFNVGAGHILDGAKAIASFNDNLEAATGGGIVQFLNPLAGGLRFVKGLFGEDEKAVEDLGDTGGAALMEIQAALSETETDVGKLEKAWRDAVAEFGNIGVEIRAKVSFIIDRAQMEREIKKATTGKDAVDLPANLNIKGLAGLNDKQFDVISSFSSWVEQGLTEGARKAEVNPQFDLNAFYTRMRKQLRPMLIEADIDPKQVDRVMTNILGVPKPVVIKPVVEGIEDARSEFDRFSHNYEPLIIPDLEINRAANKFDRLVGPREAPVKAEANTDKAAKQLNRVADPRSAFFRGVALTRAADKDLDALAHDRYAHIRLVLDESLYQHMDDRLNRLAGSRAVSFTGGGTAPSPSLFSVPGTQSLLAAATTMSATPRKFAPFGQPRQERRPEREVRHLSPNRSTVQVFLDGHVIADQLSQREDQTVAASRRTA